MGGQRAHVWGQAPPGGGAAAQVERSALWGVNMALHQGTEFVNGEPKDTNLNTYTPLRIGDAPEIESEFVPSTEVRLASASRGRVPRLVGREPCVSERLTRLASISQW